MSKEINKIKAMLLFAVTPNSIFNHSPKEDSKENIKPFDPNKINSMKDNNYMEHMYQPTKKYKDFSLDELKNQEPLPDISDQSLRQTEAYRDARQTIQLSLIAGSSSTNLLFSKIERLDQEIKNNKPDSIGLIVNQAISHYTRNTYETNPREFKNAKLLKEAAAIALAIADHYKGRAQLEEFKKHLSNNAYKNR